MDVQQFIIHRLEKQPQQRTVLTKRNATSAVNDRVITFCTEIREAYYKSGVKFGSFDPNTTSFPFQTHLRTYLEGALDFVRFTHLSVDHLKTLADREPLARGGYVVFSHFSEANEFLSIMVLNDKVGHAIDRNLELVESLHLEVNKVHVASAVNIERWNRKEEPYLSFVEGSRDLARYFLDFVGCTTITSSLQQSRGLSRAVLDYLHGKGVTGEKMDQIVNEVYEYCHAQVEKREMVYLAAIAALIEPGHPQRFARFAQQADYSVDQSFQGNLNSLRSMARISYSGKDFKLSFEHTQLTSGRIAYNQQRNWLTIKNVPDGLKKQLAPDAARTA